MITEKLQNAINEQITAEMWSSNLYLAMSFYMEKEGYNGMASWLKKQASEEKAHACEMASYIIKRGGKAKLDKIDVVPNDFGTPLEVFEQVAQQPTIYRAIHSQSFCKALGILRCRFPR